MENKENTQRKNIPSSSALAALIMDFPGRKQGLVLRFQSLSKRTQTIMVSGGVSVLAVLAIVNYLAFFSSIQFGKTVAGSIAIDSSKSDATLVKQIDQKASAYTFKLAAADQPTKTFSLTNAGMHINSQRSVDELRASIRSLGWQRFAWWKTTQIPLSVHTNKAAYNNFIASNITAINKAPVDASIAIANGKTVITDGSNGWNYDLPQKNHTITNAAETLKPAELKAVKVIVRPSLERANLAAADKKITGYVNRSVTFTLDGQTYAPKASEIGNWLDIEPALKQKTVDVTVNSGKMQAYVDKVTKNAIRPARSQITTTDASGTTTILTAGQNGMTITNSAAVIKTVAAQMDQADTPIRGELTAAYQNFSTINAADYPKWLVADVTTKRMYAYEHGTLVRSFLISAGAPKTPTVLGTYQIYNKVPIKTMRGANADGSRYTQPNVKYVNYFYKDYALHGNYWRPASYFGNVNSSHGCLGITDGDAEWIYNWAPIGTTVITHS